MQLLSSFVILFWIYPASHSVNGGRAGSTDKTYVIDGFNKVSWKNALRICQQRSMKLLAIETPEKNNRLKQILITLKNNHDIHLVSFWTSGTLSTGNQWYWTSINQPFQYTDWVPSVSSTQLNNNVCVRLWGRHNFQWHNHDCEDKLNFICETNGDRSKGEDLKDTEESDYDNDELMTTAPLITINIPDNELEKTNLVTIDDLSQELEPSTESYQDIFQRPETIELTTHKPQLFDDVPTLPFNRFKLRFVLDHLVDWETAKRICNQQGMEIAILGSEYELRIINAFLRNKGLQRFSFWIGNFRGRQRPNSGMFQLASHSQRGPHLKLAAKPHRRLILTCPVLFQRDGITLAHQWCKVKHNFICQEFL